ncbi:hypothetical protein GCM10023330_12940 [Litoribaculum gwangyangense]|uniref:Uncharacterized protein n=1 Tax=Litoribaculum gwangyangense TaxID=1130722 RepID=A0ABP9CCG8_9FLAO
MKFMIVTFTLSIAVLLILNLLLLKFICCKETKLDKVQKKTVSIKREITIPQESEPLSPTGS